MGRQRTAIGRVAMLGMCAALLNGCAWNSANDDVVTSNSAEAPQSTSVVYGDGTATVRLRPVMVQSQGGKLAPRITRMPLLQIKPGDERTASIVDSDTLEPGWSIENKSSMAGVVFNGRRLDPTGMVNPGLLRQALARIGREGIPTTTTRIAVVDFSLPADKPRWFFVDLASGSVSAKYVSHGHAKRLCRSGGCGTNVQAGFSLNTPAVSAAANTDATSVGLYKVLETRDGGGKFIGPKVVLAGLDPTNATALSRGIIIHQNPRYFDPKRKLFGRSQGCFVFGPDDITTVVDALQPGSLIFAGMPARRSAAVATNGLRAAVN